MAKKGSILMQRYELGRLLGQGNFAKVYYARDIKNGQSVAIKVIDKEKVLKAGLDEQVKREISAMRLVNHPNVLQLYDVMASKTKIYIILEFAKGGELFSKVAIGRLKEDIARWVFQQLISAVDFCHRSGVYHRDLKLENLLLDENGHLKVSDFGLSALAECKRSDELLHTICGTPAYVAPEVIKRKGYDGAKADIWSCGVILYASLSGHLPFLDANLMEMYKKIRNAKYKCPNWFPPEVRKLLSKILDPNPETRISISKIMENSWVRKGLKAQVDTKQRSQMDEVEDSRQNDHERIEGAGLKQEISKLKTLNAFDIISLSTGFDLSCLFVADDQMGYARFTSQKPAWAIKSKLEEVSTSLGLKVSKKDGGFLRLLCLEDVGKIAVVIDVEIFEFTPSFLLVEIKRSDGDALEFQKVLKEDIRPALEDVIWAWLGGHQQRCWEQQLQSSEVHALGNPL
ncbi:CBL-interacting protein kinase 2 [Dionaea muscipula]